MTQTSQQGLSAYFKELLPTVLTTVLTAGAFLGIVTLAGGAIAWARYSAVGLPAIDTVAMLPRSQLLVLGALSLVTVTLSMALVLAVGYSLGLSLVYARYGRGRPTPSWRPIAAPASQRHVNPYRDARLLWLVVALLSIATIATGFTFEISERDVIALSVIGVSTIGVVVWLVSGVDEEAAATKRGIPKIRASLANGSLWRVRGEGVTGPAERPGARIASGLPGDVYILRPAGRAAISLVTLVALGLGAVAMEKEWVVLTLMVGFALVTALFSLGRMSHSPGAFAVATAAVLLMFSLFTAIAKALDDPKMQSVAVLRSNGDDRSVVAGLYVTEARGRIWIATTRVEDGNKVDKKATTLHWIPNDEVMGIRIAATAHIDAALRKAGEMCDALAAEAGIPDTSACVGPSTRRP